MNSFAPVFFARQKHDWERTGSADGQRWTLTFFTHFWPSVIPAGEIEVTRRKELPKDR